MSTEPRSIAADVGAPAHEGSLHWYAWLLILATSIAACCFRLADARALTEHEIWVAGGAKQMSLDHDWLFPKIGDHLWLEKPPLLHWLVVVSAKLLGEFSETAVRLPSVLAGLGIVAVMTLLALHWFGARVAIFTGLLQTTTVHFITYARLAEAEMLLAFIVILALFVFAQIHSIGGMWSGSHRYLPVLFWGFVGLSNMAKGLGFGPLMILAPCTAYLVLKRSHVAWRLMISWSGLALALVIGLAWPTIVALRVPGVGELWLGTIEQRTLGGPYDQRWWYYLTTAPWQLLPWTPALLLAARSSFARARRHTDSPDGFLWCWAIVPVAVLSLFHGKHHHYIISSLCAVSPLCALGLLRCGTRFAAASVALALGVILFVHARVMPSRDRSRDDREFLRTVRSFVPPDVPLAATGGQELARHIFYVEPPPLGIWDPTTLEKHFAGAPFYLIGRRREESRLTKLGRVEVITQSRHTRKEQDPSDRFTLFRIQPGEMSSISPPHGLQ